jgi:PhoPQ-activated pathogenicity-related protein
MSKSVSNKELQGAISNHKSKPVSKRRAQKKGVIEARMDARRLTEILIASLATSFPADKIVEAMNGMFNAVHVTKGGDERPDYRTRLEATKLYFAYIVGTPVKRQEQVNYNLDIQDLSEDELIDTLSKSPAMRKKMAVMLQNANDLAADSS